MQVESFTASDGYIFQYRRWRVQPARAEVVILHGLRSHGGWYQQTAQLLAEQGYGVSILDRRGAGLNESQRGDTPSLRRLLDDVVEYLQSLPKDRRIHLCGISWGGKLAVGVPYRCPGLVNGLLLIAPGLKPKVSPPLTTRLQISVNHWIHPEKLFPIPLNEPELFTRHSEWQRFIRGDQLGLTEATARFFFHSFGLEVYAAKARSHLQMPILLQLVQDDPIINNAKVRRFVDCLPSADRTIHEYADSSHTLEFEPADHPWRLDLCNWLDRHSQ